MTANRGLFVRNNGNVGTTPIEGRLVLASMLAENAPGVPRQGLLDQKVATLVTGAADWSYNIGPCTPVLNRATNEGVYLFTLTGTTNVATTAAPGTGSRWDLVYVKQNDLDKGDSVNTAVVGVVQGVAAASSPTKPTASLPTGAYVLAEVLVAAGATSTNHANVTITQTWRYTALRGAPVPVRNTTERAEITPSLWSEIARLDWSANGFAREMWNGTAWTPTVVEKPFGHMGKNNGFTGGTNQTPVPGMAAQILRGGMTFSAADNALVIPITGLYEMRGRAYSSGGQTGGCLFEALINGGGGTGCSVWWTKAQVDEFQTLSPVVRPLGAGDKISMRALQPASTWGNDGYNGCFIEVEYIGPA
jgi:hypothetical protein